MTKIRELLSFWWYLAGSICFAMGTLTVIYRAYRSA